MTEVIGEGKSVATPSRIGSSRKEKKRRRRTTVCRLPNGCHYTALSETTSQPPVIEVWKQKFRSLFYDILLLFSLLIDQPIHKNQSQNKAMRISGDILLLHSIPLNNGSLTWKSHTTMNGCIEF